MFESKTLNLPELAAHWGKSPRQILEYAASMALPLRFDFDGLVIDARGERLAQFDANQRLEWENLMGFVDGAEIKLKRRTDGMLHPGEVMTTPEAVALRAKVTDAKAKIDAFQELFDVVTRERLKYRYRGQLIATPETVDEIKRLGFAKHPSHAYRLNGDMVRLEVAKAQWKERLEPADMVVSMADVKAIEAAAKPLQSAPAPRMDMHSLLKELVTTGGDAAQPVVINPEFISLSELLLRLQKAHDAPLTLTQAAHILLSWGLRTNGAPKLKCNGKRGIVLADAMQTKCATDRLVYVFQRGQFESDDGNCSSTDYELFGFDRSEFSKFLAERIGNPLDLLSPLIGIVASNESTPAPNTATPTPVADSASNAHVDGITTAQVAAIFDALPYTAENWPKRLSDTKWLKPARVALGAAGGATSLWCPATLAQLIHGREKGEEKRTTLKTLNSKFKNSPALAPWRTDWDEHYAMFDDSDESL